MDTKLITQILVGAGLAIWLGWDIVVAVNKREGDTITEVIREISKKHPAVPFAIGFAMGHLFWC